MTDRIKTEQRTVYITSSGKEFFTKEEADQYQNLSDMIEILDGLGIYWRDTYENEVAEKLFDAGYKIVPRN